MSVSASTEIVLKICLDQRDCIGDSIDRIAASTRKRLNLQYNLTTRQCRHLVVDEHEQHKQVDIKDKEDQQKLEEETRKLEQRRAEEDRKRSEAELKQAEEQRLKEEAEKKQKEDEQQREKEKSLREDRIKKASERRIAEKKKQEEEDRLKQEQEQREQEERIKREEEEQRKREAAEAKRKEEERIKQEELKKLEAQRALEEETKRKQEEELIRKKQLRRKMIVDEIIETERSYTDSLKTVRDVFIQPIQKNQLLSNDQINTIFANLVTIIPVHEAFLSTLQNRQSNWTAEQQIGDAFLKTIPKLGAYSTYIINYNKSVEAFNKSLEAQPFEEFLETAESDDRCNLLGLHDFLIMPVQRLPRYELLLNDLIKHTDSTHPDYNNLNSALKEIHNLTVDINEKKRESDTLTRMMYVQSKVKGKMHIVQPGRMLIKEGLLDQIIDGKEKKLYMFLFSDLIMLSKKTTMKTGPKKSSMQADKTLRYEDKGSITLSTCTVDTQVTQEQLKMKIDTNAFFRLSVGGKKEVILKASSAYEKKQWVDSISNALAQLKAEENQ